MKALVTYYSFSGNTDKVAGIFADVIRAAGGSAVMQRLMPRQETKAFLSQCREAATGKRAELQDGVNTDVSAYDLVLIGSPVWAFKPTPAVNTFLDKSNGFHGKKAVVLLTSGSGVGVKGCFAHIRRILQSKGASDIIEINIPDRKQKDTDFIKSELKKAL